MVLSTWAVYLVILAVCEANNPCIVGQSSNSFSIISAPTSSGSGDPFLEWLESLTISLPEITCQNGEEYDLHVFNFYCRDIQLTEIGSAFLPPTSLSVSVSDVGITCIGNFTLKSIFDLGLTSRGWIKAQIIKANMTGTIGLTDYPNGLAQRAALTKCKATFPASSIHLQAEGSHLTKLLEISLVRNAIQIVVAETIEGKACPGISQLVKTNLTQALQLVDRHIEPYMTVPATNPRPVPAGSLDLTLNPVVDALGYIMNDRVGPAGINWMVNYVTHDTGALHLGKLNPTVTAAIKSLGNITVGLMGINISSLATWSTVDVFRPIDHYTLVSRTAMDELAVAAWFFVNVSLDSGSTLSSGGGTLYEEGRLTFKLAGNAMRLAVQVAVAGSVLAGFSPDEQQDPGCLLMALKDFNLTELVLNTTVKELAITTDGGDAEQEIDALIDNFIELFVKSYEPAIPAVLNYVADTVVRQTANTQIPKLLDKYSKCDPTYTVAQPLTNMIAVYGAFSGAGFLSTVVIAYLCIRRNTKKEEPKLLQLNTAAVPSPSLFADLDQESVLISTNAPKAPVSDVLALHPNVNWFWRYAIPVLIFGTIAMFITSNTSYAATVDMAISMGDQKIVLPSLFDFSLGNSVTDMWNAGVYPLSVIILVFSGIWPYVKLLLMLLCWLVPLRPSRREKVLMVLDALGKWSLIDAYVLTMMMVAFRFHIAPDPELGTPGSTVAVDVTVGAHMSFFVFLLATVVSLTISHIMLHIHRHVESQLRFLRLVNIRQSLRFLSKTTVKTGKLAAMHRCMMRLHIVPILLVTALGLVATGIFVDSFNFEFRGAAALALTFLGESAVTSYSLWSTGTSIPTAVADPNGAGIRIIQVTFYVFAMGMPLLLLLALLALWFIPMTPIAQHRLFAAAEVINAWSALDVFVVSIIAALLELNQFAQFIIGDRCNLINELLAKYADSLLQGEDKCFTVVTTLLNGCWVLFTACLLSIVVTSIVMRTCHNTLQERMEDVRRTCLLPTGGVQGGGREPETDDGEAESAI